MKNTVAWSRLKEAENIYFSYQNYSKQQKGNVYGDFFMMINQKRIIQNIFEESRPVVIFQQLSVQHEEYAVGLSLSREIKNELVFHKK